MVFLTKENKQQFQLHVAYVIARYPTLTKTFVDREIHTLRKMGVDVQVFSIKSSDGPLSPSQRRMGEKITFLFPIRLRAGLAAHLHFLLRKPARYLSTLAYLLTRPHPTLRSHWTTLVHFSQGVYTARLIQNSPAEHIHAHFLNQSATIALVASRLLNLPYSVTVHASSELFASPSMVQAKLSGAKFIATCTDYNRAYLTKLDKNLPEDKIKVIYHGLDTGEFRRNSPVDGGKDAVSETKEPLPRGRQSGKPVILSVGQLRERKGFQYLIEACGILHQQGVDFECRIVGEGPMRSALEQKIQALNLGEKVYLCGAMSQEDVKMEYEQASIFALPAIMGSDGDRDGIPNVILEAMAMELPVVSTRHSGIPEVVEDGLNGLLVPPEDAAALADQLLRLITNSRLSERLGRQGRQTVQAKFDPETNAQALIEEFRPLGRPAAS